MKIGMVIAVESELKDFLNDGYELQILEQDHRTIYTAMIGENALYALQSGAGIIDASSATQYLITKFGVDVILNFGVTGALHTGLEVSDLFVVDKVCHYEYDSSPIDPVEKFQYPEYPDKYMRPDEKLIKLTLSIEPQLKTAADASGSLFVEDRELKDRLARETGCDICEMESAAIVRTCWKNEIPCLLIKCISDNYEGNGGDFWANVSASAEKALALLDKVIKRL
jgi:adenosylhomocysteine nucleosidase